MPDPVRDLAMKVMTTSHRAVFRLSGGRLLGRTAGMDAIEVTTIGRRTGEPRTVMLTVPLEHGGHPVVVASRGGDDAPPRWFLNMQAHPEVTVRDRHGERRCLARVLDDAERAEVWPKITAKYGGYAGYEKRTTRVIPVVVLEPALS